MEEKNPLEPTTVAVSKKSLLNNKRGRPSSAKAVKFTPQPKSIISRLLSRVRENCDNIKEIGLNNIHNKKSIGKQSSETDVFNQIQVNLIEEEPNCYESIHGNSIDLTSLEEDNSFNSRYLLNDNGKEQNNFQNTKTFWNKNYEEPKLIEIICYVCSHRSASQKDHRKHLSIHRNQPYTCNFPSCQYTSKLSCNLIKHKRIHTSEKPYLCDQCTFRSNFINSLKVHKRIHTSERPYSCQHCSYRCNSSSNLKKHCRNKHRNQF